MTTAVSDPSEHVPAAFSAGPAAVTVARDVIRASGPDAEAFLQGQLSQDIAPLAPGESRWSLLLQPQGKVDAWLRVTRVDAAEWLLDLDSGAGEAALARLNRFKLRTDCAFSPATWSVVSVRGPGSDSLEIPDHSGAEVVVRAEWPGVEGIDLLGANVNAPETLERATAADLEMLRILAGIPAMGAELTEDTIPAEAGIVERSVSFTKGCYTGQELVARIDSRGGNVPRRLRGVVGSGPLTVGTAVEVDGAEVGAITSSCGVVGLAYVKRAVETFPVSAIVDRAPVHLHTLPML